MQYQTDLNIDFTTIDYLKIGTDRQKHVFEILIRNNIMTCIQEFDPILVGTIPISIDIENSDLDIICYYQDHNEFIKIVERSFSEFENFKIRKSNKKEQNAVIANFKNDNFDIEVFGQDIPTRQQNAYRHMIIEHKLLCERDDSFRQIIINLKKQGYKTEPAFGIALGLTGNPYVELLDYEK